MEVVAKGGHVGTYPTLTFVGCLLAIKYLLMQWLWNTCPQAPKVAKQSNATGGALARTCLFHMKTSMHTRTAASKRDRAAVTAQQWRCSDQSDNGGAPSVSAVSTCEYLYL